MLHCNAQRARSLLGGQAGGRAVGRKYRAAWRGVARARWLGRRAGRADWWEGAQARRVLAVPAPASAWCNVSWTCLPPGSQARRRAGAQLGQGGVRRAGQGGGGLGGRAGARVGWAGANGIARVIAPNVFVQLTPPIPAPAPCAQPHNMPPLCPLRLLLRPSSFCVVSLAPPWVWTKMHVHEAKTRAWRRGSAKDAETHLLFLCGLGGEGVSLQNSPYSCP